MRMRQELRDDIDKSRRLNRDEIVRKTGRVHPMEAACAPAPRALLERAEGILAVSKGRTQHHENARLDLWRDIRRELGMPEEG